LKDRLAKIFSMRDKNGLAGEDEVCLGEDREFQGETDDANGEAWHLPNEDY
jgi:hypothetical protein